MTTGLRSIRPLSAKSLQGVDPSSVGRWVPKFEWVDPKSIYVEEAYQRSMEGGNSISLVRRIVGGFHWARFKPPICVRLKDSGNVLVCVDGQHTATAAASHPEIGKIPVMVVNAEDLDERADAFVGHNKDRLNLTQMAVYYAECAAGHALALSIARACRSAGAQIPRVAIDSKSKTLPVGTTIAIGTLRAIAKKQGEGSLARILKVLVRAGRAPIKADEIAAVSMILASAGTEKDIDARLAKVAASSTERQWNAIASAAVVDSGEPLPSAIAAAWCRKLGLRLGGTGRKSTGAKGIAPSMIAGGHALKPIPEPAKEAAPATVAPTPPKVAAPAAAVRHNGVEVDRATGTVRHRGAVVSGFDEDEIALVAALAKVMPSILVSGSLAKQIGLDGTGAEFRIFQIRESANQPLARARLEIKQIPKMGYALADLGPG